MQRNYVGFTLFLTLHTFQAMPIRCIVFHWVCEQGHRGGDRRIRVKQCRSKIRGDLSLNYDMHYWNW